MTSYPLITYDQKTGKVFVPEKTSELFLGKYKDINFAVAATAGRWPLFSHYAWPLPSAAANPASARQSHRADPARRHNQPAGQ